VTPSPEKIAKKKKPWKGRGGQTRRELLIEESRFLSAKNTRFTTEAPICGPQLISCRRRARAWADGFLSGRTGELCKLAYFVRDLSLSGRGKGRGTGIFRRGMNGKTGQDPEGRTLALKTGKKRGPIPLFYLEVEAYVGVVRR